MYHNKRDPILRTDRFERSAKEKKCVLNVNENCNVHLLLIYYTNVQILYNILSNNIFKFTNVHIMS